MLFYKVSRAITLVASVDISSYLRFQPHHLSDFYFRFTFSFGWIVPNKIMVLLMMVLVVLVMSVLAVLVILDQVVRGVIARVFVDRMICGRQLFSLLLFS